MTSEANDSQVRKWAKSRMIRFFSLFTFTIILVFFSISLYLLITGFPLSETLKSVSPFFYLFLYKFSLPWSVPLIAIIFLMYGLYSLFFSYMAYSSIKNHDLVSLDSPLGFFVFMSCATLTLTLVIFLLEEQVGLPIGGTAITTFLQQNPLVGYASLIYAPFVEELGFRIIPLGFFSVLIVFLRMRNTSQNIKLKDLFGAFLLPGKYRNKFQIRLGRLDWILIILTSALFAYAHIYFGAWDWGKFADVFVFAIFLAIGFLKFGVYMDISMHWFTNGLFEIYVLDIALKPELIIFTVWLVFVIGIAGLVALTLYVSQKRALNKFLTH